MPLLTLSSSDRSLQVELPVCGQTVDLLTEQMRRCVEEGAMEAFAQRIAAKVDDAINFSVEPSLRRPSTSQVMYATAISSELGIPLPPSVLRYREAMNGFLDANVEKFKQRTGAGSPPSE